MQRISRVRRVLILTAAAVLVLTGVAVAAAPATGTYRATGKVHFVFTLTHGTCFLPRPVSKPNAPRGKVGTGLCLSSTSAAAVSPDCGVDGHAISGETADISLFDHLRVTARGLIARTNANVGYIELELTPKGRGFTGYVRVTDQDGLGHACDTGKLTFTAAATG